MLQPFAFMRKIPAQKRAHQTMDEIFEATAQLLNKEGGAELNTNRVAERAGFSIGTLYSYFPNKASLLRAMVLRELKRHEDRFDAMIEASRGGEPDCIVRMLVRQALAPFNGRQLVRRRLIALVGSEPAVQLALHEAIDRMTDRFLDGLGINPVEVSRERRFLLMRSVLGPIRAAGLLEPELLASSAFEDELVRLILALLDSSRASGMLSQD